MMVQLKPEIYRLIVKALLLSYDDDSTPLPEVHLRTPSLLAAPVRQNKQIALANMMRVSKVRINRQNDVKADPQTLHEICKTELYDNCLVGNIDTFVQGLGLSSRKADLLCRVKTLRLWQADEHLLKEPTYLQLIADGEWHYLVAKVAIRDYWRGLVLAMRDWKFADRFLSGFAARIMKLMPCPCSQPDCQGILGRLKCVTMSAESVKRNWGHTQLEFDIFTDDLMPPPIPLFFISLPSVDHYCQRLPTGPLALPNQIIKIVNPPAFVTIHPEDMLPLRGLKWLPPIVLGTTNRYMFHCNSTVFCPTDAEESEISSKIDISLERLYTMLEERPVLHIKKDGYEYVPSSSVSLDGTTLEFYDYLRYSMFDSEDPFNTVSDIPSNLRPAQLLFNERVGRWKGKVSLKHREECPPCSACGFEGDWKVKDTARRTVFYVDT
jgi:hypothetical protein